MYLDKHPKIMRVFFAVPQSFGEEVKLAIGIASGASAGELIFHEVCEELSVEHRLYLPMPQNQFRNRFVYSAGTEWQEKFDALLRKFPSPPYLAKSIEQRANLWLIYEALTLGAEQFTLLAVLGRRRNTGNRRHK